MHGNAAATQILTELDMLQDIADCCDDPTGFVRYVWPWKEYELKQHAGPYDWQLTILDAIRDHLRKPETHYTPFLCAVASGHGIGKSALVSWIINWAMATCEDTRVIVTANTGSQLTTKTVPEVTKWFHMGIESHLWNVKSESITANEAGHEKIWRTDFIPWSIQRTEAFAGLHNQGKRIVLIFDEASAIDDKIWDVAQGALTDSETEIIWLAFGNPTRNSGRFRECFGKNKHRWLNFQIDSRNVPGTNKKQIDEWKQDYGEDSDFFRVRVRGEFPRAGGAQFISSETVAVCRKFKAEGYGQLPKFLSVDVARFGDDQTVIAMRHGRKFAVLAKLRGLDTVQVAERVIKFMESEAPDATVIDGDGIGAGVVDQIKFRGFGKGVFEFHGGEPANDSNAYFNRRAECWGHARAWLQAGAEIPDDPELESDLTGIEYGFDNKGRIQLEKKSDMKARGLSSPDQGDALAYSFAVNVQAAKKPDPPKMYEYGQHHQGWMG